MMERCSQRHSRWTARDRRSTIPGGVGTDFKWPHARARSRTVPGGGGKSIDRPTPHRRAPDVQGPTRTPGLPTTRADALVSGGVRGVMACAVGPGVGRREAQLGVVGHAVDVVQIDRCGLLHPGSHALRVAGEEGRPEGTPVGVP